MIDYKEESRYGEPYPLDLLFDHKIRTSTLLERFIEFHQRKCQDPRHRIFALRNISKDGDSFPVDYLEDIREVYMRVSRYYAGSSWLPVLLVAATAITGRSDHYSSWALTPNITCAHRDPSSLQGILGFSAEGIANFLRGGLDLYTITYSVRMLGPVKDYLDLKVWMVIACHHRVSEPNCVHCRICRVIEQETINGNLENISEPDVYFQFADRHKWYFQNDVLFAAKVISRSDRIAEYALLYSFALENVRVKAASGPVKWADLAFQRGDIYVRGQHMEYTSIRLV